MIWANRATRRPLSPTGRFFSAPTGTSTASRRIKRFEKNMIEHELQKSTEEHTRPACEFGRGAQTIVTHYIQNFGCEKVCGTMFSARRRKTTRQRRILPGTSGQNDHALHKRLDELPFQNWIGNFVGYAVVPVSEGSGLAAVARAEPRQRLERNRHSANFSGPRIEVSLANTGGARLVESGGGPRPCLPDRYAVG